MTGRPAATVRASLPLQTSLVLGALPSAVACARLHARNVMYEWNLPSVADSVELVVSDSLNLSVCSLGPFCCFSGRGLRGFRGRLWRLGGG